ncbi:MAG: ASKHA domain-containing protein [Chloroflexota bacterium]|nr:ASKHA domain-containing protein [Chloroflexota bacterium]
MGSHSAEGIQVSQKNLEQKTFRVVFQPAGRREEVTAGTSLLVAARQAGVEIESICGGRQTCGKCQVQIEEGSFARYDIRSSPDHVSAESERERDYHERKGLKPGCRLSCAALVEGDLVVTVPESSRAHKQVVRKDVTERAIEVNPTIRLCYVELPPASLEDERSDWARLRDELEERFDLEGLRFDSVVLATIQPALRKGRGKVTATVWQEKEVIRVQSGYHEQAYGVAVDVGTTTLVAHLTELRSGQVLATESAMNPQISFGEDLMSRISFVMEHGDGLDRLNRAVVDALSGLVADATASADIVAADVVDMVVVGNTVMHHIFLGISPEELGGSPFAPAIKVALDIKARDLGLVVNRGAYVHVPPIEAGYVGADNVAAIIAEKPYERRDITLLIDVGTNGEIVLGNRDRMLSASSPTGPAFEGAQIRHGMRAAPGAIERVRIDPATLGVRFKVIGREDWIESGDNPAGDGQRPEAIDLSARRQGASLQGVILPAGICGSGTIEGVAELFLAGLIDPSGRFVAEAPTSRLKKDGLKSYFVLAWAHETSTGREIVIHADDVRAIQLAKAALYAGAKLLMQHYGVREVDRIVLAGAFGSYISPEHAMVLGLIPDCDLQQVTAVGNAAGDGALILLLDRAARLEAAQLAETIEHIQTATDPAFQDEFVAALYLPHVKDSHPHLDPILNEAMAQRVIVPSSNGSEAKNQIGARSRRASRRRRQQRTEKD